jgi:hypothetical protein
MIEIKSRWTSVTDRGKWSARGASLVAKAKATKAVWFPPKPAQTAKNNVSSATNRTKKASKKATGAAKKSTARATGAAKKSTASTR